MIKNRVTLKILLFLVVSDFLETFSQFFFKKTAIPASGLDVKNIPDALIFLNTVFFSPYLWIAFLLVFLTFVLWSTILSKIDLSVAVPIASFSYILVPLVSIIFLHEKVSALDWTGIIFILSGVIFVSISSHKDGAATQ